MKFFGKNMELGYKLDKGELKTIAFIFTFAVLVGILVGLNSIPTEKWAHPKPSEPISFAELQAHNKEHGFAPPSLERFLQVSNLSSRANQPNLIVSAPHQ